MRRKSDTTTLALCLSLTAHALGLSALAWWVVMTTPPPREAAIDRNKVLLEQLSREMSRQPKPEQKPKPDAAQPPPKPEKKKPAPVPPPPKEPDKFQKPDDNFKDDSGEHDGVGQANRTNHGDKPMQAHQGPVEQAALMKQDAKKFDEDSPLPSSAGKKDDSNDSPKQTSNAGETAPDFNANAKGNDDPAVRSSLAMLSDKGPMPLPKFEPEKATPKPTGEKNPAAKVPAAQPAKPQSDLKELAGKKTEISDTESMALAKAPALTYEAGQLLGRKGLKVQTKQPRYGYASEVDMESLGYPRTLLGVKVDADGNVLDVKVLESSGSTNIDRDREIAVWHWVLEPARDKDGNITDYLWTISLE
jgi:hypothetical protein